MISFLAVGIGGAFGAIARYSISLAMPKFDAAIGWPWQTFIANLAGSLLIGLLVAMFFVSGKLGDGWRLFLAVGLLGGFTTFSTFSLEAMQLVQAGRPAAAVGYVAVSAVACPVMCWIGWTFGRGVS